MTDAKKVGVIGAGAWGTALAQVMAVRGHDTTIWALEPDCAEAINSQHENIAYLPDHPLAPSLRATNYMQDIAGSDLILIVSPAQHVRASLRKLKPYVTIGLPVVLCAKGIELNSLSLMTTVLHDELPNVTPVVLSGPSFAKDVVAGKPTAVTLACENRALCEELAETISTPTFRPYTSSDIIGAEVGGAVKNVLAIACGITLGLDLGRSAHSALIGRGFAEMSRLGMALGADATTLTGLCGLGDLVLTCSSELSRNMSCGMALGQGQDLAEYMSTRNAVIEGVSTAPAIQELSEKFGISMPICMTVANVVSGKINVEDAVHQLLNRPLRAEFVQPLA